MPRVLLLGVFILFLQGCYTEADRARDESTNSMAQWAFLCAAITAVAVVWRELDEAKKRSDAKAEAEEDPPEEPPVKKPRNNPPRNPGPGPVPGDNPSWDAVPGGAPDESPGGDS